MVGKVRLWRWTRLHEAVAAELILWESVVAKVILWERATGREAELADGVETRDGGTRRRRSCMVAVGICGVVVVMQWRAGALESAKESRGGAKVDRLCS